MFSKMQVMQVKEMVERNWSAADISRKCNMDTDLVLQILAFLNSNS